MLKVIYAVAFYFLFNYYKFLIDTLYLRLLLNEIVGGCVSGVRGQSYLLENRDSQQKESP